MYILLVAISHSLSKIIISFTFQIRDAAALIRFLAELEDKVSYSLLLLVYSPWLHE